MKHIFKENWEKVDEVCPSCGQVTKRQRGITRQNIKRLFSLKVTYTEFLITFMLIMILILAYAYLNETKTSRAWLNSMTGNDIDICNANCLYKCRLFYPNNSSSNLLMPDVNK